MAFTEALRILIDADSRGAVRGIEAVGKATDRELGRSQKRIDTWSRGLTTAGAGMVALGAASLLGLGKAAQASEQANLAVVKLDNTLSNMPRLAGENRQSFIDLAQAIQSKTAADADQIVEAEALLGTFQLSGKEIRSLTPLVVDLSRKFGIDMNSAAIQVGKALDGQIGALKRNGISIDENLFKTDRYAAVTKALREQVGGFATAEGKTFQGSLERLKNQLGDVAEGVGTGAVDAFTSLFGVVEGGINKIKDLSPATQEAIGKFATFGSVALVAAGGLSFTIGQLVKMKANFDIARTAIADFAGAGGLGRLARVGVAIGGLIALREILGTIKDDIEDVNVGELELELLRLGKSGEIAGEQLGRILGGDGPLAQGFKNMDEFSTDAIQFREDIDALDDALAQLAARDPEAAAAAFKEITAALEGQGIPAERVRKEFDAYRDAVAGAKVSAETATGGVDSLTGGMEDQADATTAAQDALQEYLDTLSAMFDPLFGATDALLDNREAQQKVTEAELALIDAVKTHGEGSAEAAAAQQQLSDAYLTAGQSALDVKQKTAELSAAVEDGTVNIADAKAMLADWVGQGLISQATADDLARKFDGTASAADRLGDTDPNVAISETGGSRVQGTLSKVQQAAINAGRQRPNVRVSATDRASSVLRNVQRLLFGIPRSVTTEVRTVYSQINAGARPTGRQHGGPVGAGKMYIVGEDGPELLLMGSGYGQIIPNSRLGFRARGGPVGSAAWWRQRAMGIGIPKRPPGVIYEDEPGWDPLTMGNRRFGTPVPVAKSGGATRMEFHITGSGGLYQLVNKGVRTGEIQLFANGQRVTVR